MFAFRVNSSLYNTNNGPLLNTLSGRGVLLWWRFYLCSQINHTWKIDNLKRLNSKFWELIYWFGLSVRSIDWNIYTSLNVRCFYLLTIVSLLTLFFSLHIWSFVCSFVVFHYVKNDLTLARAHTMKLSTINYSQHDYRNCIFWRVLYSIYIPLMLFTYYLFALLCNLVWILDTLTLSVLYIS